MKIFRACNQRYANKLDGEGARIYGGRWNSPGRSVVYASSSRSLAILETLVHVGTVELLPDTHVMLELELPDTVLLEQVLEEQLVAAFSNGEVSATRRIGDAWVDACSSAVLKVPSVIVPEEFNILINPAHPDAQRIILAEEKSFQEFDQRLFKPSVKR